MIEDPGSLLVNLDNLTVEQSIVLVRTIYEDEYLTRETRSGRIGVFHAHDGEEVVFFEERFEHAFYRSKNRTLFPDDKSVFDGVRATRIRWIHEVINASDESVECWDCAGYSPKGPRRRLYVFWDELYVVWLVARKAGGFRFESAYCAPARQIREKYIRGSRKIKIPRD